MSHWNGKWQQPDGVAHHGMRLRASLRAWTQVPTPKILRFPKGSKSKRQMISTAPFPAPSVLLSAWEDGSHGGHARQTSALRPRQR